MRFPWQPKDDTELYDSDPQYSISDPAIAQFLGMQGLWGSSNLSEFQALGLTAVYRAQMLIAGTIAGLPLKVFEGVGANRQEIDSFLSTEPAGPYDINSFNFWETVLIHLLNHGEAYLEPIENGAKDIIGAYPIHPLAVTNVRWHGMDKVFKVQQSNGTAKEYFSGDLIQILGPSVDNIRGLSPLQVFRQTLQTSRAGEIAANRTFANGALMGGIVTTDEDIDETEARAIKEALRNKAQGAEHAGDIAFINRSLKFSPWAMSNVDAEFLASRTFQIEEVGRMYGVPPHLLGSTEKVTSWGSGLQEQDAALAKYTLQSWTSRIESALLQLLPEGQFAEFNYKGLLAGTPADEINLLIAQVTAGILTKDEARALLNRPALPPTPEPLAPQMPAAA